MELIIETINPKTECIISKIIIKNSAAQEIIKHLNIDKSTYETCHTLTKQEILKINQITNSETIPKDTRAFLRAKHFLDDLPYQIHTGRELEMMLSGNKPLSVFVGQHPPDKDLEEIPERLFDPYVNENLLVKHEQIEPVHPDSSQLIRRVLYARPEEAWRIKAYNLLMNTAKKVGWSEGFERMEGSLLGYTDEQNDSYIDLMKRQDK